VTASALVAAGLALGGLALFFVLQIRKGWVPGLTLSTPPTLRLRSHAASIAREADRHGLAITVAAAAGGTRETLEQVNNRQVDLALVPGGLADPRLENIRQVAALEIDPLHLLVRPELFADVSRSLGALRGKRVSLGVPAGVGHSLSSEVLRFAKLRLPSDPGSGDVVPLHLNEQAIVEQLDGIEPRQGPDRERAVRDLPDAVFTLSPLPSVAARKLVTVAGYRLVALPFGEAFTLDRNVAADDGDGRVGALRVSTCFIPAYLYDTAPPVPAANCPTIGTHVLLVAHKDASAGAVAQLLELIHQAPLAGLLQPTEQHQQPEFDFHAGAYQYRKRNEPVVTPQLLAHLGSALGGVGAFVGGMVAFYGLLRFLRTSRFEYYYHEVRRLELVASGAEFDPDAPTDPSELCHYLEARLTDLKCRAVADFAAGGLKGEGLMQGIIALINDTRNSLARLIAARKRKT
jgi:TRAP-type uncharacterized transport system substrate-binding protein